MRRWVHGCFVTMISISLIYRVPVGLAVDRNPQSAAGKGKVFLKTGLICFLVRGDNLPSFASDFSKIMTCVFLSQLTIDCCWEAHVHAVSFPLITSCYRHWAEMQIQCGIQSTELKHPLLQFSPIFNMPSLDYLII